MERRPKTVLFELGAGALCAVLGAALLKLGAPLLDPSAAANEPPAADAPRTPAPDAPPVRIGAEFDSDAALPSQAEQVASYKLYARLDDSTHVIHGKGTIHWRNTARTPARELYFHLYLNAFKNDRTVFLRSAFGGGRSGRREVDWGYVDVKRLVARELGGVDLWRGAEPHTPSDPDDQTDIRVPLPGEVAAGEALTLEIEFSAKLPSVLERTGYAGSFHFAGQWFPKLARREPDGSWAHFPFHAQSEFYADFGRYEVTLDVPEAMRVGATGALTEERIENGRRIARHQANNVHDFAWTAWDQFRERREQIDGVDVRLLYPPGHDKNASTTLESLRFALPELNRRFGRYPHPTLTVVHPPEEAADAGGMEYPTLITTGGPWYAARSGVRAIESVTVHELAHQWFQGLIATNEHAWPFLDEGLTTFVEATLLNEAFGRASLVDWPGLALSERHLRRTLAASYAHDDVVALPAASFSGFRRMAALVYARTSTIFETLANVYGRETVDRALGRYARRYRYQHPTPRHLIAAIRELAGEQAADNLQLALFERGWVDYVVSDLGSVRVSEPTGIFDRSSGRETREQSAEPTEQWESRVQLARRGSLRFPVEIELVFEDGSRIVKHWDGRGNWTALTHTGTSPLVAASVDPHHRILLDDDLLNNVVGRSSSLTRSWERATYVAQLALSGVVP